MPARQPITMLLLLIMLASANAAGQNMSSARTWLPVKGGSEKVANEVATPMLSFFNPKEKRGFILLAEQKTRFGNNGLFVEEDAGPASENKRITFVVSAPGVREQRYVMCGRAASEDRGAEWKEGDNVTLRFKIYKFQE